MIKLLKKAGYAEVKGAGKGSHVKLKAPGKPMAIVPDQRELTPGVAGNNLSLIGARLSDLPELLRSL